MFAKNLAEWVFYGTAGWLAAETLESASLVGLVMAASFLPTIPGSLAGGWLADRIQKPALLASACFMHGLPGGFLLLAYLTDSLNLWTIAAVILLQGTAAVLLNPIRWATYSEISDSEQRNSLLGWDTVQWETAKAGGGMLAGWGLQIVGASWVLLFSVLCAIAAVVTIWFGLKEKIGRSERSDAKHPGTVTDGAKWLWRNRKMCGTIIAAGCCIWSAYAPIVYLLPVIARNMLETSSLGFGIMAGCVGIGGGLGGLAQSKAADIVENPWMRVMAGFVSMFAGLCLLAWSPTLAVACAGVAFCGAAPGFTYSVLLTQLEVSVPENIKGGVLGAWGAMSYGICMPVALLAAGFLSGIAGLRPVLAGLAVVLLAAFVFVRKANRDQSDLYTKLTAL